MATVTGWPRDSYAWHADELADVFAGLIRRDNSGLPVSGMLGDPDVSAVASSWQLRVDPFMFVERVGTGVQLSGESAAVHVDIAPAAGSVPAGQARIDLVCWDTAAWALVVVEGAPAVSPSVPSAGGMVPVAQYRVNAGDGQTIQSRVTKVFGRTGLVTGGRVAQGVVSKRSVGRGTSTGIPVSFPAGMFTEAPNVQVSTWGSQRETSVLVDSITASGCTIRLVNDAVVSRLVGAQWRAEQL